MRTLTNTTAVDIFDEGYTGINFPAGESTEIVDIRINNQFLLGHILLGNLILTDDDVTYSAVDAVSHLKITGLARNCKISEANSWLSSDNAEDATLEQVTRDTPSVDIYVPSNHTRMHPNLGIDDNTNVDVSDDSELLVI